MKHSKCDFFKRQIHYLGHLISTDGISPLPDKLDTIKHIPTAKRHESNQAILRSNGLL